MFRDFLHSLRQVSLGRAEPNAEPNAGPNAEPDADLSHRSDENRLETPGHLALYSRHQSPHDTAPLQSSVHPSVYSQLNVLNNETRVVNLQPGSGEDPIVCDVKKVSLYLDDLRHQALSYVWGSSTLSQSITLNGQPHHITANLFATLHRL